MKKFIISIIILSMLLIPTTVSAKEKDCRGYYIVKSGNTIEMLMKQYNLTAWDIIANNREFMIPPSYSLLVGAKVCIPKNHEIKQKSINKSIIQAPAGEFIVKKTVKGFVITLAYYPKDSNWYVRVKDLKDHVKKIGKIKVPNKNVNSWNFNVPAKEVCLKNMTTDYLICRIVRSS